MATVTSNVVQITVTDEGGYTKSFNIDEPKDNLSLIQIKNALAPAFSGRWWLGKYNSPITSLKSAQYTQTIKTQIAGEEVTVTPASLNPTVSNSERNISQNFTITGGSPSMVQFVVPSSNTGNFQNTNVSFTEDTVSLSTRYAAAPAISHTINCTLKILINGNVIDIPIIVNVSV